MKVNVTKKSDGDVGPAGYVVRAAHPTKSTSEAKTTGNKNVDDMHAKNVGSGLTT
jgi:hypothetical protein